MSFLSKCFQSKPTKNQIEINHNQKKESFTEKSVSDEYARSKASTQLSNFSTFIFSKQQCNKQNEQGAASNRPDYQKLGFQAKRQYLAYLIQCKNNQMEMTQQGAGNFRNQLVEKKKNLLSVIIQDLEEQVQQEDWIIENYGYDSESIEKEIIQQLEIVQSDKSTIEVLVSEFIDLQYINNQVDFRKYNAQLEQNEVMEIGFIL